VPVTAVNWTGVALVAAFACLVYAGWLAARVVRHQGGSEVMRDILELVHAGAVAFAKKQYSLLARVSLLVVVVLAVLGEASGSALGWQAAASYAGGVILAGLAGHLGMLIATRANARTTNAAVTSLSAGFRIAYEAGTVTGLVTVGVGLLGLAGSWLLLREPVQVAGFALGMSTFAIFARVGGGTFAKATDIGSALALQLEGDVPGDNLQNPGVIADQIGDNVSGVTGMGADISDSLVGATAASMLLATVLAPSRPGTLLVVFPLLLGVAGLIGSLAGQWAVQAARRRDADFASFRIAAYVAAPVALGGLLLLVLLVLPGPGESATRYLGLFWSAAAGWVAGMGLGWLARFDVSVRRHPVRSAAAAAQLGTAPALIRGLSSGLRAVALPSLILGVLMAFSYFMGFLSGLPDAGWYYVSIGILGMLSPASFWISMGAYGPVADNAHGIAKMAGLPKEVRARTLRLDSLGNSAAAAARGYAGATAALTSIILLVAYFQTYRLAIGRAAAENLPVFDLLEDPALMIGLLLGGMLPFLFSYFTLTNVTRTSGLVVGEIRRQFREIPGLRGGSARPDLGTCVSIAMVQALKGLALPAAVALAVPLLVGLVNPMALGGVVVGATICGFLLATTLITAGGVWSGLRYYLPEGQTAGEGPSGNPAKEPAEEAMNKVADVCHLFGDPLRESAGPAINTLIKLMCLMALVLAPVIAAIHA